MFRSDLYYRLAVLTIRTPSLKDRDDDLFLLAHHFLREAMTTTGNIVSGFSDEALEELRDHTWPGNLRELRNRIVQSLLRSSGSLVTRSDLNLVSTERRDAPETLHAARDKAERAVLESALSQTGWKMSSAAKRLKISRMTLYRLVEKHGLTRD
jgi:DNA-binding NtrC family response regulator